MVSSLEQAEEWLANDACIVSYSDIFYDAAAVGTLIQSHAPMAITYDPSWRDLWEKRFANPLEDAETFRLKSDGTLAEIGFCPKCLEDIQGQYMGLLRFTPQGWESVRQIRQAMSQGERDRMHMTGTLQKVIEAGQMKIEALAYSGTWGEVDSEDDLSAYCD
jgi:choline kinase